VVLDTFSSALRRNLVTFAPGADGAEQYRLTALVNVLATAVLEAPSDLGDVAEPEGLLPGTKRSSRMSSTI
jgi:hypothetical protein